MPVFNQTVIFFLSAPSIRPICMKFKHNRNLIGVRKINAKFSNSFIKGFTISNAFPNK